MKTKISLFLDTVLKLAGGVLVFMNCGFAPQAIMWVTAFLEWWKKKRYVQFTYYFQYMTSLGADKRMDLCCKSSARHHPNASLWSESWWCPSVAYSGSRCIWRREFHLRILHHPFTHCRCEVRKKKKLGGGQNNEYFQYVCYLLKWSLSFIREQALMSMGSRELSLGRSSTWI